MWVWMCVVFAGYSVPSLARPIHTTPPNRTLSGLKATAPASGWSASISPPRRASPRPRRACTRRVRGDAGAEPRLGWRTGEGLRRNEWVGSFFPSRCHLSIRGITRSRPRGKLTAAPNPTIPDQNQSQPWPASPPTSTPLATASSPPPPLAPPLPPLLMAPLRSRPRRQEALRPPRHSWRYSHRNRSK